MATIDQTGIKVDSFADVYEKLAAKVAEKINPLLPSGKTVDTSETSIFGRLISIIAEPIYNQEQLIEQFYFSKDIDSADGLNLDELVRLSNMYRKTASKGYAYLHLYGDIGVTVNAGNEVAVKNTNDKFVTLSDVTFSTTSCVGVEYEIGSFVAGDTFTINYALDFSSNEFLPITVVATSVDTAQTLCNKIAQQANNVSTLIEAVAGNEIVTIKTVTKSQTATFTNTANLTATRSYMPVGSDSVDFPDVQFESDTITIVSSSVLGWRGVNNPFPSLAAEPTETDNALKNRYRTIQGTQFGMLESMKASLDAIPNVRYSNIQENIISSVSPDGRSGNGISVIVLGGDEDVIAETIFKYNAVGCLTDGIISRTVTDVNGNSHTVKFSRPEDVEIEIVMNLNISQDFPTNGADQIRQKIVEYVETLNVGESVAISRLFTPINEVKGFAVSKIKVGVVGSGIYYTDILPIEYNQIARISYTDVKFGGA